MDLAAYYAENQQAIENPKWRPPTSEPYIHDWELYVPIELEENWKDLSPLVKAAVHMTCKPLADNEEWD